MSISDIGSRASTQESAARSHFQTTLPVEEVVSDTTFETSMEIGGPSHGSHPDIELDFNTKIKFIKHNAHGALIYKDPSHRFLVKVEDHPTDFNASPFVNYQGDRYIGPQGEMYLVVEDPEVVDTLGGVKGPQPHEGDELPPRPLQEGVKLVNSIVVRFVPLDNPTKALYRQIDKGSEFFYERDDPLNHSLTEVKILYVFKQEGFLLDPAPVAFVDKYNQEWTLMLRAEVRGYTYKGRIILWRGKGKEDDSEGDHGTSVLDIPISPKSEDRRSGDDSRKPKGPVSPHFGGLGGPGSPGDPGGPGGPRGFGGTGGTGGRLGGPRPGDPKRDASKAPDS